MFPVWPVSKCNLVFLTSCNKYSIRPQQPLRTPGIQIKNTHRPCGVVALRDVSRAAFVPHIIWFSIYYPTSPIGIVIIYLVIVTCLSLVVVVWVLVGGFADRGLGGAQFLPPSMSYSITAPTRLTTSCVKEEIWISFAWPLVVPCRPSHGSIK